MWYCGDGGLVVLLTPFLDLAKIAAFIFSRMRRLHILHYDVTNSLWSLYQTILTPNTSAFIHSLYVTRANVDENSQDSLDWLPCLLLGRHSLLKQWITEIIRDGESTCLLKCRITYIYCCLLHGIVDFQWVHTYID